MQFAASIGSYLYKSMSGRGQGLHPEITRDGFTSFSFNPVPYIPFMVNERKMDTSKSQSVQFQTSTFSKTGLCPRHIHFPSFTWKQMIRPAEFNPVHNFPTQCQVMFIAQTLNQPGNFIHCCRPAGALKIRFFQRIRFLFKHTTKRSPYLYVYFKQYSAPLHSAERQTENGCWKIWWKPVWKCNSIEKKSLSFFLQQVMRTFFYVRGLASCLSPSDDLWLQGWVAKVVHTISL